MTLPLVASTTVGGGAPSTTWSINKPSGLVAGDLLTIWIIVYDENGLVISSPGSDFKFRGETFHDSTNDIHVVCYQKIAGVSEPSSWSGSLGGGAPYWCTLASRVTGNDSSPFGVLAVSNGNALTQNVPAVPISSTDELIQTLKVGFNEAVNSGPSGYTQQVISDWVNVLYSLGVSTTGTVGSQNLTTNLSDFFASISIASKSHWNGPRLVGTKTATTTIPGDSTILIPEGAVAGDLAVIYCSGKVGDPAVHASFTQVELTEASATQNESCFSTKTLTSADILAGTLPIVGSAGYNELLHTLGVFHSPLGTPTIDAAVSVDNNGVIAQPTVITFPSATMSTDGSTVIFASGGRPQGTKWYDPSFDLVFDEPTIGSYSHSYFGHIDFETSGSTGTKVITHDADYAEWTAWTVVVRHPDAGTLQKVLTEDGHFLMTESSVALDLTTVEPITFTDDFNRANGALGVSWNSDAKWKIESNKAVYDSAGTVGQMRPVVLLSPDQFIEFDWHVVPWPPSSGNEAGLSVLLRSDGGSTSAGYILQLWQSQYSQQSIQIGRVNNWHSDMVLLDTYGGYPRLQDNKVFFGAKGHDLYVVINDLLCYKIHDVIISYGEAYHGPIDGYTALDQVGIFEVDWISYNVSTVDNITAGTFEDGRKFTIFEDTFLASDGTDWNTRSTYNKGWVIDSYGASDHGKIISNRVRLYSGASAYSNKGMILKHGTGNTPSVGTIPTNEFEMTADVLIGPSTTNSRHWFSLLENDDAIGWTAYCDKSGYGYLSRSLGIDKPQVMVDGGGISYTTGDVVHWRIKCTLTTCMMRLWKNSDAEPSTWNNVIEYLDPINAKGGSLAFRVATWAEGEDIYMDLDNVKVWCY